MSMETEAVLDRRRLRRRLSLWRVIAVIAGAIALGALAYVGAGAPGLGERDQIARVTIEGVISENRAQLQLLKKISEASHVKGVIVYINSPGGTATGGEALFDALRGIAKSKPVVAQLGTVATSAAYMAGIAADHIIARGNTITGSIGVIWQWPEVTQLLEKLGVKMNAITSGPLKANPNPYQPLDSAGRQVVEQMIADSQRWFLGLVASRRGLATASVPGLEAGRVYTGRDALGHKLVDAIGDEADAVAWLIAKKGLSKSLKVVDWKPKRDVQLGPWRLAINALARLVGLGGGDLAAALADDPRVAALRLDGLIAIWLPFER